jgi:hypothetical protein
MQKVKKKWLIDRFISHTDKKVMMFYLLGALVYSMTVFEVLDM